MIILSAILARSQGRRNEIISSFVYAHTLWFVQIM